MVILKHFKIIGSFAITIFLVGCIGPSKCPSVASQIIIDDWIVQTPIHGVLYRYKKGSNFSIIEQKNEDDFKVENVKLKENKYPYLLVEFSNYSQFKTDSDYKLVLDNKIEYRISDLLSGDVDKGCRLPKGKVNQCRISFDDRFSFSSACGVPVK